MKTEAPTNTDPAITIWVEVDPAALRLAITSTRTVARAYADTSPDWRQTHEAVAAELERALRDATCRPESIAIQPGA